MERRARARQGRARQDRAGAPRAPRPAAARRLLTVLYISHDDRALRRPAFAGDAPPERIEDLAETAFDDGGEALAAAAEKGMGYVEAVLMAR